MCFTEVIFFLIFDSTPIQKFADQAYPSQSAHTCSYYKVHMITQVCNHDDF